jgi:AraC-like DNA-binding protein
MSSGAHPASGQIGQPFGLARMALMVLERTTRFGLLRDELLREARLNETQLRDPDGRIPVGAIERLWRAIATRATDPTIGLRLGKDVRVREFGLVGYAMACSKTLGAALRRLDRYDRIVSDTLNVEIDIVPEAACVRIDVQPQLRALRPAADARVAAMVAVFREIAATPIELLSVRLPYRKPRHVTEYEQFFRAPIEFGALTAAVLVRTKDLETPITQCDETLAGYLDRLAEHLLTPAESDQTVRGQMRRILWSELQDGVPTLETLARRLGMSGRTLQRRLRDESTSYQGALIEFRRDAAPALLRDGRLAVSEVAFLLGYEDPSSFQRAFRQAFGVSPRDFRRRAE